MSKTEFLPVPVYLTALVSSEAKYATELSDTSTQIYCKSFHGPCEVELQNGDSFKGDMQDGYMTGRGEYRFASGAVYSGGFSHNLMEGKGRLAIPASLECKFPSQYEGDFHLGRRHGAGVYDLPLNGFKYSGTFKEGKMEGEATIDYKNGSVYQGQVANGFRHGFGVLTYKSGNYYEGNWQLGIKCGFGKMHWLDRRELVASTDKYEGEWRDNKPDGWGCIFYFHQNRRDQMVTNRYLGQFKNGLRHGYGTFYYADGSKYKGQWREGMKSGIAEHTRDDGSCIDAVYEKDRVKHKLATRLDDKDSLLCHHVGNVDDIPDVGNLTLGESTNQRIGNMPVPSEDVSRDLLESKLDLMNNSASNIQASNPALNRTAGTLAPPSQFKPELSGTNLKPETEVNKPAGAAARRAAAQKAKLTPVPRPVAHLQANPYLGLINLDDILEKHTIEERFSTAPIMTEAFLRIHSQLCELYSHYSKEHPGQSRNGSVFTRRTWWRFIREYRLCTCRATPAQVDRLVANGKKNNFELEDTLLDVSLAVDRIREAAKSAGSLPDGFEFQPASPLPEKVAMPKLASFDDERSEDEKQEREKLPTNQSDMQRGSLSLDIDVVELMTDPTTMPEVALAD